MAFYHSLTFQDHDNIHIQTLPLYLLLVGPSFLLLIHIIRKNNNNNNNSNLPPGPRKLPLIGNLHQLGKHPHLTLQHLAHDHGPLMHLQLGRIPTLVISSADAVRSIFKTHDLAFSGRPILYSAKKLSYECSDMTFSPYGEYWRQVRKISILELLSLKRVQSFRAIREEEVHHLMGLIDGHVNLSEMLLSLMNDIICRIMFGRKYRENGERRLHGILEETQALLGGFCLSDFFPGMEWVNRVTGLRSRLQRNFLALDGLYDEVIKEHLDREWAQGEEEDLVHILLRVQKDPTVAIALTSDHVKGMLTDMFVAGTDTSSTTLVWIMAELVRNPTSMRRAQEEVRRIIGRKERVEEIDLHQLLYLKMVVKEGLRLHPPAPLLIPRETKENCKVGEFEIPAKTRVFINAKAISMDPKCWENPEEFRPERFIDNPVDFKGQDFEFIPFGDTFVVLIGPTKYKRVTWIM